MPSISVIVPCDVPLIPSFNLGLFGDETEKAYGEFVQMLKNGGLDKYIEEWNRQRSEFLASQR